MPQVETQSASARALKRVLDDDDNTFTAEEMAEVAGCSRRHIYKVVDPSEPTNLSAPKRDAISRYLAEHGEYRVAYAGLPGDRRIVPARYGEADGDATDDVMHLIKCATGLDDAYDALKPDEALRLMDDIRHELADIEAEIARMKARQ